MPRTRLSGFGTVLFGSYNHFFVPPPIENVLAGSAGLTQLVSEIGQTAAAGAGDHRRPVRGRCDAADSG